MQVPHNRVRLETFCVDRPSERDDRFVAPPLSLRVDGLRDLSEFYVTFRQQLPGVQHQGLARGQWFENADGFAIACPRHELLRAPELLVCGNLVLRIGERR